MRFIAPLYALGAALAIVPVLIHLFGRDRAPRLRFPAARLLLAAERKRAPRARLEQWLLVLLRALAIAAIAFVLARPARELQAGAAATGLRQAAVIVLDDSLSMNRRDRGRSLFARAQKEARTLARATAEGSELAVLSTSGEAHDPLAHLERDRGRVLDALDRASARTATGNTSLALARAATLLAGAEAPVRRIYLFSDLAEHGFDQTRPRPFPADGPIGLTVISVGDQPLANDAVVDLQVMPASEPGQQRLRAIAQVRADARPAHTRTASLLIDGRPVARGLVELRTAQVTEKRFEYVIPGDVDPQVVTVALDADDQDSLALDDRRSARVAARGARLLIVDGAPGASRREDETFYVETALRAARGAGAGLELIGEDALGRTDLSPFAAVLLCNPRPDPTLEVLRPFVERGGALFITVGDNLDGPALSTQLAALLPSALEGVRDLSGPGGVAGGALHLSPPGKDLLARVPSLGEERGAEAWRAARTYRVALVRPLPSEDPGRTVLAHFEDGTPALLERRVGRGKVALLLTTVDRAWSDLAIQPVFPALLVELTDSLTAQEGATEAALPDTFDPAESDPKQLADRAQLATPPPAQAPGQPPLQQLWHALAIGLLLLLFSEALLGLRG